MNLISNCCLNDFILQKWDLGHTSPFAWADVDFASFYNLLTDYDNINFWKYELFIKLHPYYRGRAVHGVRIDDKVNITYIHYLQDENYQQPTRVGADVYCPNAAEFIDAMYRRRLKRMDILQEDPIFVLEWEHLDYNEENFMKLLKTDLKYKVVVITNNEKFKDTKKDNLLVIYDPAEKGPKGLFPAQFAEKYADTILKFMHNK